jgi:hypothetical protein
VGFFLCFWSARCLGDEVPTPLAELRSQICRILRRISACAFSFSLGFLSSNYYLQSCRGMPVSVRFLFRKRWPITQHMHMFCFQISRFCLRIFELRLNLYMVQLLQCSTKPQLLWGFSSRFLFDEASSSICLLVSDSWVSNFRFST